MAASTFLDILRSEVARMQALYPDREGELARAHVLILHGLVVPSPDDPATGQVLSSDAQTVYHVNGTCSCPGGAARQGLQARAGLEALSVHCGQSGGDTHA
jgi:hypothetical protein